MGRWAPNARGRFEQAALELLVRTVANAPGSLSPIDAVATGLEAAGALRRRGVADPAASLTAEAGIAAFKIAFERWVKETNPRDLSRLIRASLDELKAAIAARHNGRGPRRRPAHVTSPA